MKTETSQWKKRVAFFKFVYAVLINEWNFEQTINAFKESTLVHDDYLKAIFKTFIKNYTTYLKNIESKLDVKWKMERLSLIELSVIISACSEFEAHKIDKAIIIDQAVVTVKHYGDVDSFKFVNSILDKLLK